MDDLADAVLVFFILALTLGVAHLLDDHLLRGLGGDAAEIHRRQLVFDQVARAGSRIAALRIGDQNFGCVVFHLLDDLEQTYQPDLAGVGIDAGPDFVFRPVTRLCRLLDRFRHRFQHEFALDRFFPRDRIGNLQKFQSVRAHSLSHRSSPFLSCALMGRHPIPSLRTHGPFFTCIRSRMRPSKLF